MFDKLSFDWFVWSLHNNDAARQLVRIAFESRLVDLVCAHTLAEYNASTRVLQKCGMTKVSESLDPDVGLVWRWEICRV